MTTPQDSVQSRFIQNLASGAISSLPILAWSALILAFLDVITGAIRWGANIGVLAEALLWATPIFMFAGVLILTPVVVLGTVVAQKLQMEGGVLQATRSLVSLFLGPSGVAVWPIVPLAVASIVTGGAFYIALVQITTLPDGVNEAIEVVLIVVGAVVSLAAYRWLVKGRDRFRARSSVIIMAVAALGFFLLVARGQFLIPHRLILGLAPILLVIFAALASARQPIRARLARTGRPLAVGIGILGLVLMGVYEQRLGAHAFLMERSLLAYPALQLLWFATDVDGDGHSNLLMGGDCAAIDISINPDTFEVVGNQADENCAGGALEVAPPHVPPAPQIHVNHTQQLPDVYVIMIDTLRADAVHSLRNGVSITPTLDVFATAAARFHRAYSPSNHTDEALPATFTSNYPSSWHQNQFFYGIDRTLPGVLGEVGYWSVGVSCLPWAKNFTISGFELLDNRCGERRNAEGDSRSGASQAKVGLEWLDKRPPDRPVFMWLHLFDPHAPYLPNPDWMSTFGPDPYAHEVATADAAVASFLDGLNERGLLQESVVIIYSDHGDGIDDHWSITHGRTAYEEIIRVPLLMRLPNIAPVEVDTPVSTIRLFSTLVDFLGIQGVGSRSADSLMPLIVGRDSQENPIFVEGNYGSEPTVRAMIDGRYKLVFDNKKRHYLLFDVVEDPDERQNLVGQEPEVFLKMKRQLWMWWDEQFNDVLLRRKAKVWDGAGVRPPKEILGAIDFAEEETQHDVGEPSPPAQANP